MARRMAGPPLAVRRMGRFLSASSSASARPSPTASRLPAERCASLRLILVSQRLILFSRSRRSPVPCLSAAACFHQVQQAICLLLDHVTQLSVRAINECRLRRVRSGRSSGRDDILAVYMCVPRHSGQRRALIHAEMPRLCPCWKCPRAKSVCLLSQQRAWCGLCSPPRYLTKDASLLGPAASMAAAIALRLARVTARTGGGGGGDDAEDKSAGGGDDDRLLRTVLERLCECESALQSAARSLTDAGPEVEPLLGRPVSAWLIELAEALMEAVGGVAAVMVDAGDSRADAALYLIAGQLVSCPKPLRGPLLRGLSPWGAAEALRKLQQAPAASRNGLHARETMMRLLDVVCAMLQQGEAAAADVLLRTLSSRAPADLVPLEPIASALEGLLLAAAPARAAPRAHVHALVQLLDILLLYLGAASGAAVPAPIVQQVVALAVAVLSRRSAAPDAGAADGGRQQMRAELRLKRRVLRGLMHCFHLSAARPSGCCARRASRILRRARLSLLDQRTSHRSTFKRSWLRFGHLVTRLCPTGPRKGPRSLPCDRRVPRTRWLRCKGSESPPAAPSDSGLALPPPSSGKIEARERGHFGGARKHVPGALRDDPRRLTRAPLHGARWEGARARLVLGA